MQGSTCTVYGQRDSIRDDSVFIRFDLAPPQRTGPASMMLLTYPYEILMNRVRKMLGKAVEVEHLMRHDDWIPSDLQSVVQRVRQLSLLLTSCYELERMFE